MRLTNVSLITHAFYAANDEDTIEDIKRWDNRIRLAKKAGWDTRIRLAKKWDNRIRLAKKLISDWDKRIRLAKKSPDWNSRIRLAKKNRLRLIKKDWDTRIRLAKKSTEEDYDSFQNDEKND